MTTSITSPVLPRYRCHKEVFALKIQLISTRPDGGLYVTPADPAFTPFVVEAQYVPKHRPGMPQPGWYWVQYDDGYQSFSPAEAFESGYTLIGNTGEGTFDFGAALQLLRKGCAVYRANWNGEHQYICLQVPDEHSKMTLPYIYISTVKGELVPWLASQTDMLATDWMVC